MALDSPYIGHVIRETEDKIVVFGSFGYRFDVSKPKIKEVGRIEMHSYLVENQ